MYKHYYYFAVILIASIFISECKLDQQKNILKVLSDPNKINNKDIEFNSLEEALDASLVLENCEIQIEPGDYYLSKTIVLDSLNNNLKITSTSNQKPVFYGGKLIENWTREDKYWVADVGEMDFRTMEVNNRFAERSRLPEEGTFHHLSTFKSKWLSTAQGGFSPKPTQDQLLCMIYKPEDLTPIKDLENTEVTLYHSWDETLVRVASNDVQKHQIRFTLEPAYPAGAFEITKYVVWNSKYGMTKPGQWYLDRKAGKVYYWPLEDEVIEKSKIVVPLFDELIKITNANNIRISNIEFRSNNSPLMIGGFGAKWFSGAINFENSNNLSFDNLSFCNLTTHALKGIKCNNVNISNCDIHDIGGIGIRFVGSDSKISNNLIHDIGLIYPSTIALYVNVTDPNAKEEWEMGKDEGNVLIDHNEIYNAPYVGISCGGHDTHITNNRISRVVQVLTDGGGIYVTFCNNLVLKGNFVSDIINQEGAGTSAYYLDELTNNALVEGNLSINVHRPVHTHYCDNNTVRNNVFIVENGNGRMTFPRCNNFTIEKNILMVETEIDISGMNVITNGDNNIFFSTTNGSITGADILNYQTSNEAPIENGSQYKITDPEILEYKSGVVKFKENSVAFELGIEPIDVSGAGSNLND